MDVFAAWIKKDILMSFYMGTVIVTVIEVDLLISSWTISKRTVLIWGYNFA